jgi:hypothetical protein
MIRTIQREVENRVNTSSVELAKPLSTEESLSEQDAARLLQKQIITESHRSWEERKPNFKKIWAFGANVHKPKNFFSLDRWPLELQTGERQQEILTSGPARPSLKEIREKRAALRWPGREQEEQRDPKVTYIHGKPYFAFGETAFQQAALSWEIEQDLANGKSLFFHRLS